MKTLLLDSGFLLYIILIFLATVIILLKSLKPEIKTKIVFILYKLILSILFFPLLIIDFLLFNNINIVKELFKDNDFDN